MWGLRRVRPAFTKSPSMEVQILPLVPEVILPVASPATTRSRVPRGYGVQEQCLPFTAATALGFLVRCPITFGLCRTSEAPPAAHRFTSPLEGSLHKAPVDERVFYVMDDPACRYVGNAFTFEAIKDRDRGTYTPVAPGISFFDRNDQLDLFKLHLPYILRTPDSVDTLFLSPMNRLAPLEVLSGIVETDWYANPVNLIVRKPPGAAPVHVNKGDPIAQLVFIERSLRRPELKPLPAHARLARELALMMGEWYRRHRLDRSAYKNSLSAANTGRSTRECWILTTRRGESGRRSPKEAHTMVKKHSNPSSERRSAAQVSASVDELLAAALDRGGHTFETGRSIVTFKADAAEEGVRLLGAQGVHVADARDFREQAITRESVGDAEAVVFFEIGAAVIGGTVEERGLNAMMDGSSDSAVEAIEPEYFVFPQAETGGYLRGFLRATEAIAQDLRLPEAAEVASEEEPLAVGATWGLIKCRVPPSPHSGMGMRVAVVDGGMDLGHPDFAGRPFVTQTFVGEPVQDLLGHGTHLTGTAYGPKSPAGPIPRYGTGYKTLIHVAKVITTSGGTTATVLAGLNWAIGHRCPVILITVGAQTPVQAAYTAAGAAALSKGCLIIAAAGHSAGGPTGAPANSPTIMAVASLEPTLIPSPFNSVGKIEIAAPGRDVFSSWPRPVKYKTISGTSMAAAHVAGCAALWAETSPALRGAALWRKLQMAAKPLPFPAAKVGKGLVQAAP